MGSGGTIPTMQSRPASQSARSGLWKRHSRLSVWRLGMLLSALSRAIDRPPLRRPWLRADRRSPSRLARRAHHETRAVECRASAATIRRALGSCPRTMTDLYFSFTHDRAPPEWQLVQTAGRARAGAQGIAHRAAHRRKAVSGSCAVASKRQKRAASETVRKGLSRIPICVA